MEEYHRMTFLNGIQAMSEKHLEAVMLEPNITVPEKMDPTAYLIDRKTHFASVSEKVLREIVSRREPAWQLALMDLMCHERLISSYNFRIDSDRLSIMIQPVAECRLVQISLKGAGVKPPPPQN